MGKRNARKSIQELSLIDDFLFTEVMLHKETGEIAVRLILERALGINAKKLIIEPQKTINGVDTDSHGIRMDVDVKLLAAGTAYDMLPELVTIWILPYDPFGKNQMIYFVKNIVEEFDDIYYNDGIRKIFLYTDGKLGGNSELKQLLTYIKNSSIENVTDKSLEKLHLGVEGLKKSSEIGVKYMQMWEIMEYEKKQSRQEGIEEERDNGIRKTIQILAEMNISEENIAEQLMKKYALDEDKAKEYIADALAYVSHQ